MYNQLYRINNLLFHLKIKWFKRNLHVAEGVRINAWPTIVLHQKASIFLGENVLLNSSNRTYHVNMFTRVKLMCDKPNASISIGKNTRIHGSCIHAFEKIEIGENCLIAANCQIFDSNGHGTEIGHRHSNQGISKPIKIGNNVWIGTGCIILPGTFIGSGSVIAAGSVVIGEVPEKTVYGGNPAKLLKKLDN
jgi:acetyltransferase-like isoleucine patch superfamily enzyme